MAVLPSSRSPAVAAEGSVRHAGSTIARHTANGTPCAAAIAPAICDSISTASAPLDRCSTALSSRARQRRRDAGHQTAAQARRRAASRPARRPDARTSADRSRSRPSGPSTASATITAPGCQIRREAARRAETDDPRAAARDGCAQRPLEQIGARRVHHLDALAARNPRFERHAGDGDHRQAAADGLGRRNRLA